MDEEQLVNALRSLPPPDAAAAQARARELVLAAHAGRRPARRRPRWVAAALATMIAAGLALTAVQGAAVARWVRDALRNATGAHTAELGTLPGGGRLLVLTGRNAWIAGQGITRAVSHTNGVVGWSAFGHYIACACGQSLQAVALNGRVAWTERFAAPVSTPTWSPDGNRIAFGVGRELHVTAGDGTATHALRVGGRESHLLGLAAWRPGPRHELAVHDTPGQVSLIATDSGRYLARFPIGPHAVSLSWSSNGQRLLAASARTARLYDARGRLIAIKHPSAASAIRAAQLSPTGRQIAYLLTQPDGRQEALLSTIDAPYASRVLLAAGVLGDLLFSPDGRWLLVGWRDLDSWMFFTTGPRQTQIRQITHVAARLGNGEPAVSAWCCVPPSPTAG